MPYRADIQQNSQIKNKLLRLVGRTWHLPALISGTTVILTSL